MALIFFMHGTNLRRWTVSRRFFQLECSNMCIKNGSTLPEVMLRNYFDSKINKLYHTFLVSVYYELYIVMMLLQSEKPLVPEKSYNIGKELYIRFLKMYMNEEYIDILNQAR